MSNFECILNFLRHATNSKTDKEMCAKLGIPYGTLDTWKARKSIPTKRLYDFSRILNIDIDTIMNGNVNLIGEKNTILQEKNNNLDYKKVVEILKKITNVDTIKDLSEILNVNYTTFNTWAVRGEIPMKRIKEFSEKLGTHIETIISGTNNFEENKNITPQENTTHAKEILEKWRVEQNLKTYKELADYLGVAANTIDVWKQRGYIPEKNILKYTQMNINNTNDIENIVKIRYFPNVYASAGFGNDNSDENFQTIYLDKNFLVEILGISYKTQYDMIKIFGDSMEPFIQNGSFVIVDTSKNSLDKIKNADVAIFRYDGELFCKRIRKNVLDDEIIISSDNIGFEDKKIKKSALKDYVFLGVVICSCNTKIFLNQIERV